MVISANGQLDAIAFVESIPFAETRGYVKNALSFAVFYSFFAGEQPVLTENEGIVVIKRITRIYRRSLFVH